MNNKQHMVVINNRSNAAVLPFPDRLELPEKREVNGVKFYKTNRKKTFPDYVAVIYTENPCTIDLDAFADPIEAEKPKVTTIYGRSDDLIEFDGHYTGEIGCYGTDEEEHGVLIVVSDGTVLEVKYGKAEQAVWGITVLKKGTAYTSFEPCDDPEADIYSDVVTLIGDIKWAYASTEWSLVQ